MVDREIVAAYRKQQEELGAELVGVRRAVASRPRLVCEAHTAGLNTAEIARLAGISTSQVNRILRRAEDLGPGRVRLAPAAPREEGALLRLQSLDPPTLAPCRARLDLCGGTWEVEAAPYREPLPGQESTVWAWEVPPMSSGQARALLEHMAPLAQEVLDHVETDEIGTRLDRPEGETLAEQLGADIAAWVAAGEERNAWGAAARVAEVIGCGGMAAYGLVPATPDERLAAMAADVEAHCLQRGLRLVGDIAAHVEVLRPQMAPGHYEQLHEDPCAEDDTVAERAWEALHTLAEHSHGAVLAQLPPWVARSSATGCREGRPSVADRARCDAQVIVEGLGGVWGSPVSFFQHALACHPDDQAPAFTAALSKEA